MGDDVKQIAKKILNVVKGLLTSVIIVALPIILIIILISSFLYFIIMDDGEDDEALEYAEGNYSGITIGFDGEITSPYTAQELWDNMIKDGSNIEDYLDKPEELRKLINAQAITQYVDLRDNPEEEIDWSSINSDIDSKKIQGIIKLKRKDSSGNIKTLTYIDRDTFRDYIEDYNKNGSKTAKQNALDHFTLDIQSKTSADGEEILEYFPAVATWTETSETIKNENKTDPNGNSDPDVEVKEKKTYGMTMTNINYQDLVKGYTMPFDYLWQLLVISEDKDFVLELADLVFDSKIEITIYDNLTTNTNNIIDTYAKNEKTITDVKVKSEVISWNTGDTLYSKENTGNWEDKESTRYKTTHTTFTKTNTLEVSLSLADVWFAKYQQDYKNEKPEDTVDEKSENLEDIPYESTPKEITNNDTYKHGETKQNELDTKAQEYIDENGYIVKDDITEEDKESSDYQDDKLVAKKSKLQVSEKIYRYSYTNRKRKTTNKVQKNTYVASPKKIKEKTDKNAEESNFVKILLDSKYSKARKLIIQCDSWLFDLIRNNEKTEDLLDLTKYLLYKATGTDYGVTEFDFSIYELKSVINGALLNITSTNLTKEEFVSAVQSYAPALSKAGVTQVFRDNAGLIYDVCVKNNINPVLCAAQGWKEQHWNDPNTSPFNFWGIAVYNGQNFGNKYPDMESAVEGYCKQINSQMNGKLKSTYQATASKYAKVNSKYKGDMSTIYDIFSAYAYIGKGHTLKEEADYAASYIEDVIACARQIFGEGALEIVSYGPSSEYANATAEEKVKWLFPDGIPQTEAELMPYLTDISVPVTSKEGKKYNMNVQVHKAIAQDVYNACFAAQQEGFKIYTIGGYRKFGNGTSGGQAGGLPYSQHDFGLAVDINPTENGQFKNGRPTGDWFYDPGNNPYSIESDSALVQAFKAAGWGWGADWRSSKDYMHFSFCGT